MPQQTPQRLFSRTPSSKVSIDAWEDGCGYEDEIGDKRNWQSAFNNHNFGVSMKISIKIGYECYPEVPLETVSFALCLE